MSIELTTEQLQAADASPVRVTDPNTNREYVVVAKAAFERMQERQYDDSPWTDEEMDALAWETGQHAGWDDPRMDEYNHYQSPKKP
jgi:hypothetical protein